MSELTLGSLFDGSGGFPLAGMLAGIKPLWASEIEPFPIRVTTKRIPQMRHLGDISRINGADIPPVDIITFGSPCQDMSIAGRRSGLDGARSSLFYEAIRIVKEMRGATNGKNPRYIVWENVLGAFSSCKGEDFRAVLETVCRVKDEGLSIPRFEKWKQAGEIVGDNFSVAWRVLDAEYWGVPQRRKRIFLVADFADRCAGNILFESESVLRYSSESKSEGQGTAETAENCSGAAGWRGIIKAAGFCTEHSAKARSIGYEEERSPTLRAGTVPAAVYENHSQDTRYTELGNVAPTVSSTYGMGGNNQPFVVENLKNYDVRFTSEKSKVVRNRVYETETSRTLDTSGNPPDRNHGGVAVVCVDQGGGKSSCNVYEERSPTLTCTHAGEPVVALQGSMIGRKDENGPQGSGINEDVSFTLNATDKHAVAYGIDRAAFNQGRNALYNFAVEEEVQPTMVAKGAGAIAAPVFTSSHASFFTRSHTDLADPLVATDYKDPPIVNMDYIVRRLTPTECARLQGFPDWWCAELDTDEPTEADIEYWAEVFETHRIIAGISEKPKTRSQIVKWLKKPHSDSAEYKMWGNGVALPCVYYILAAIQCTNSSG